MSPTQSLYATPYGNFGLGKNGLSILLVPGCLVAGVERTEDAEGAPALAVPMRVGSTGGVALFEVHNLALVAADPPVLPALVGETRLDEFAVLGGGGGTALLLFLGGGGAALVFAQHKRRFNGPQASPRLLRVHL